MSLVPIMVSDPTRADARRAVCQRLADLGLAQPHIESNLPGEKPGYHAQGELALRGIRWAIENAPGQPVLFLEDDILLDDSFPEYLRRAIELKTRTITFLVFGWRHYPLSLRQRVIARQPVPRCFFRVLHPNHCWGCQAVFLPFTVACDLADRIHHRVGYAFDNIYTWYLSKECLPLYAALPNQAQHRQDLESICLPGADRRPGNKELRRSWSFGLPVDHDAQVTNDLGPDEVIW